MALSVFSCLCFRGNLLSWFTIFSYYAAQKTMLRSLQRQVDFQVVNCTGSKDPRICPPTLTKTYVGVWFLNVTWLNVGWAEGKCENAVLPKECRTFFCCGWLILKLSFGLLINLVITCLTLVTRVPGSWDWATTPSVLDVKYKFLHHPFVLFTFKWTILSLM